MAILKGAVASVLLHIRRGTPVDGRDLRGLTPLMLAAAAGREDICILLLAEGADPASLSRDCRTASDLAAASGHVRLAGRLRPPEIPVVEAVASENARIVLKPDEPRKPVDQIECARDDWDTEDGFKAAISDLALVPALRDVQTEASRFRGLNPDTDWQDVAVRLPAPDRRPDVDISHLSAAIARCVTRGGIAPEVRRYLVRRLPGIAVLLEDLGLEEDSSFFETLIAEQLGPQVLDRDEFDDAHNSLEAIATEKTAKDIYLAELDTLPSVDRDAEQSMFRTMRDSRQQLFRLLVDAIPCVWDVAVGQPSAPLVEISVPPAKVDGLEEAEEGEDDFVETGDVAGPDIRPTLIAVLRGVHGNCSSFRAATFEKIDVDLGLVEDFERALSAAGMIDKAARLKSGTARYLRDRNRIVEAFLPWIPRTAAGYTGPGLAAEDLVQECNIGLIRAVERFDVDLGNRFITYAIWWFRQAASRARDDQASLIRVPAYMNENRRRVADAARRLQLELGRPPDNAELAFAVGLSLQRLQILQRADADILSTGEAEVALEAEALESHADSALEIAFARQRKAIVTAVLRQLGPKEERILRSRFGIGGANDLTLEEIGQLMSVTRERIRQIEHKAIARLARPGGRMSKRLRPLLGRIAN